MNHSHITKTTTFLLLLSSLNACFGTRTLNSLYKPPPNLLKYHNGPLLEGNIPISILWYGNFKPSQKSILIDFLLSLTPLHHHHHFPYHAPSLSKWWKTVDDLMEMAGKTKTHIFLANQTTDPHHSLGKLLKKSQIEELAERSASATKGGIVLILTAADVAVEGFCMSHCGYHSSLSGNKAYIWVGNSDSQCPGQCAWPFHQPLYGPQTRPLVAPNGDVGVDGMVINIATLLAGTVTDPFGRGYFQGEMAAPVEVVAACSGVFGKGAYSGYTGEVLVDSRTGGSYNVQGLTGREYLVPAMLDPYTSSCSPIV
ncbi:hypothetical protein J5N97_006987 [Dioscorea zingiberensis]|uniref:Uncharacterized protein n=1 Tax=Dioscorea zingiberensis TaxID=325984 RepID=A0A9D5DB53_9LILI|nr:hypothetical protein J5N97_006987 [Dioscorea zingiberensis]